MQGTIQTLLRNHTVIHRRKTGPSHAQKPTLASLVCVYHVYKDIHIWKPLIAEKRVVKQEFNDPMDKHTMQVMKGNKTVGHLPHEFSCGIFSHTVESSSDRSKNRFNLYLLKVFSVTCDLRPASFLPMKAMVS